MDQDFVGKNILKFRSIGSTNTYSRQLLNNQVVVDGTVVWAHSQEEGRGMGNNTWDSNPGENLTFSVILHPLFLPATDQFYLSMIVSLGITDFLGELIEDVYIKWPNDIYVGHNKIAGMLMENFILENSITDSIVGIGININQADFGDHLPNPVSLSQITSQKYDLRNCLDKICGRIDVWYSKLKREEKPEIKSKYTNQLLYLGSGHRFRAGNRIFTGFIRGVDDFGSLEMVMEDGSITRFGFREVEFLH